MRKYETMIITEKQAKRYKFPAKAIGTWAVIEETEEQMILHRLTKNGRLGSDRPNNILKVKKLELNKLFKAEKPTEETVLTAKASDGKEVVIVRSHKEDISDTATGYRQVNGKAFHNESNAGNIAFRLEYESGVRIGDFQDKPKVQKYHTKKEFYELFSPFFRNVQISEMTGNVNAKCENVRRIPWERIEEALKFEFDLPYPDGSRMGLVDEAISAFKHRYEIFS